MKLNILLWNVRGKNDEDKRKVIKAQSIDFFLFFLNLVLKGRFDVFTRS